MGIWIQDFRPFPLDKVQGFGRRVKGMRFRASGLGLKFQGLRHKVKARNFRTGVAFSLSVLKAWVTAGAVIL